MIISTIVDNVLAEYLEYYVYKDLIISTIVDPSPSAGPVCKVYKDLIISTIVDLRHSLTMFMGLYGLDNFYYRRLRAIFGDGVQSLYGLDNFYYRRCHMSSLMFSQSIRT